ncbi:hypothetical protein GR02_27930 [Escherichia coli]|nr:hypothetical protein GR02_27930 [Escherichia coli]
MCRCHGAFRHRRDSGTNLPIAGEIMSGNGNHRGDEEKKGNQLAPRLFLWVAFFRVVEITDSLF